MNVRSMMPQRGPVESLHVTASGEMIEVGLPRQAKLPAPSSLGAFPLSTHAMLSVISQRFPGVRQADEMRAKSLYGAALKPVR